MTEQSPERVLRVLRREQVAVQPGGTNRERLRLVHCPRRWVVTCLAFVALGLLGGARSSLAHGHTRFLINYGADVGEEIGNYDVVVLDPDAPAASSAKRHPGTIVLGYLSLGEVHGGRGYVAELQANGSLLRPNPNWPDARFIDLRDRRWHKMVIERLVPEILAKGFNGLFFDTLDDAEFLETQDPARFAGMVNAAADLLRAIRQRFPGIPLMVNRGYAVLPHAAGAFDMLLGESVSASYDPTSGIYKPSADADYKWQVDRMRDAQQRDPKLRLFSLDYWNPDDPRGIARIYTLERTNGFIPYVGTRDLTQVVPEP